MDNVTSTSVPADSLSGLSEEQLTKINRGVDLFYEIGRFRHQDRAWKKTIGNDNVANVSGHNMRVNYLAVYLALEEGADPYRTNAIAQVHDSGEIRGVDLTPFEKVYVTCDEDRAIRDTFGGTVMQDFLLPLYQEYKVRETLEAKCVKDADILDSLLELHELRFQGCMYLESASYQLGIKRTKYHTQTALILHDAITAAGFMAVQRGQQAGESTFRNGTYAK